MQPSYRGFLWENGWRSEGTRCRLLLIDCGTAPMDGYETTRLVLQPGTAYAVHVPIVALTALAVKGAEDRCLAAGMDDYLAEARWPPHCDAGWRARMGAGAGGG